MLVHLYSQLLLKILFQLSFTFDLVKHEFIVFSAAHEFIEVILAFFEGFVEVPYLRLALNDVIKFGYTDLLLHCIKHRPNFKVLFLH